MTAGSRLPRDVAGEKETVRLEVRALGKSFAERPVITDIGFRVHAGEFVAVLGPSGAGKTTLFRCIAGLTAPSQGQVRVLDKDVEYLGRERRRRVAVIFQQFNLIGRRSALGNVLAGRLGHVAGWRGVLGRFTRDDRLAALESLERVGMLHFAEQRADTLSGGQQQRVAVARAAVQRPALILADEPVASLDPQASQDVLGLLRDICRQEDVAVVCSLHQVDLARRYADRILGLSNGRLVSDLPAGDFDAAALARLYGSESLGSSRDDVRVGRVVLS